MSLDTTAGNDNKRGWPWRTTLIVLAVASALLLVVLVIRYWTLNRAIADRAFEDASGQALAAADQLEEDFAYAMTLTEDLTRDLNDGALAYEDIASELQRRLEHYPSVDGITVAFDHSAYSPDSDLFFVYVSRDPDGGFSIEQKESLYDYTLPPSDDPDAPATEWYYLPSTTGPTWSDPFVAAGSGPVLIKYGIPFSSLEPGSDKPAGVVAVDYSLEGMRDRVTNLDLGRTGYGAVYTGSGAFLSHPVPENVVRGNIFTDEILQDEGFQNAARRALEGDTLSVRRMVHEKVVWDFFTPITVTDWGLVIQLSEDEFLIDEDLLLNYQVAIVLAAGAFLFFLIAVLLHFDEATRDRLWLASITFSIIGLVLILLIIGLTRSTPEDLGDGVLLTSKAQLDHFQDEIVDEYEARGLNSPVEVPTGVLIQSAQFPQPSVVTLNGYIWQRIPKIDGVEISPGISLPQLIDEPAMIDEVYREERENETLIIWTMTAALRQVFDPREYPLDLYDISMRLAPLEFKNNVLLVPDIAAYNSTSPSLFPGIDTDLRINNWKLKASAFGMDFRQYGTNMGMSQRPTIDVPELAFNIRVERLFLGPFIAFFLPAFVATIMIFGFLLIDQKPDEPEEIVTALTYTAALFFVVAVLHAALRENAAAIGLTYLEHFYLLLYVLTLLVALNSFLVVNYPYLPIISTGNNLISKLLFWPVVVGFMLLATISVFVLGR